MHFSGMFNKLFEDRESCLTLSSHKISLSSWSISQTKISPFWPYVYLTPGSKRKFRSASHCNMHDIVQVIFPQSTVLYRTYLLLVSSLCTLDLICAKVQSNLLRKSLVEGSAGFDMYPGSDATDLELALRDILLASRKSLFVTISSSVCGVCAAVPEGRIPLAKGLLSCNGLLFNGMRIYSRRNKLSLVHMLFVLFNCSVWNNKIVNC